MSHVYDIRYMTTKSGKQLAHIYSYTAFRWLPISLKGAEALILKGEAQIYIPAETKKN